ncbi:MAG: tetratricopeptide repeat protein [Maribacter sp.]|nr:tetratricopeptide repeat protein [Maribacter sp.]
MIDQKKGTYILIILALFLLITGSLWAQNAQIDSLKRLVQTGKKDTAMVTTLNDLSIEILKNEAISESLTYSEQALELSNKLGYLKGKANAEKNLGLAKYYQGDYLEVLDHWTKSLETYEAIHDTLGIAKLVNNLGAVYYNQGSHTKALEYYLRSLRLSEKTKDSNSIAQALLNLGGLYAEMHDYEKALEFFNQIEKYQSSISNSDLITSYLMGVGEVYFEQGRFDDALKYYEEALAGSQNITLRADNLIKLGVVEFKMGKKEKAIGYLNEAYRTAQANNQQSVVVQALIAIGLVHKQDNYTEALRAYSKAEILAKQIDANDELRDIYQDLSNTYASKGDFSNAFKYQTLYLAKKDSLFNLKTDDKIRGLQFNFDLDKKQNEIGLLEQEAQIAELQAKRQKYVIYGTILSLVLVVFVAVGSYKRYRYVKRTNKIIEEEKNRSENLLLNILPDETALELKQFGKVAAKKFESVTVMFTDFKGFTSYSNNLSPEVLVKTIDYYFSKFDAIIEKYDLEKIKTIGDAYMVAGGLPFPTDDHPIKMVQAAFEIAQVMEEAKLKVDALVVPFDVRIGINTGSVVAGVVGTKKFAYDIWGDTVNVAARMESLSEPGMINISESTYLLIKDTYRCEHRGQIHVKNKGMMDMYFVHDLKDRPVNKASVANKINS